MTFGFKDEMCGEVILTNWIDYLNVGKRTRDKLKAIREQVLTEIQKHPQNTQRIIDGALNNVQEYTGKTQQTMRAIVFRS